MPPMRPERSSVSSEFTSPRGSGRPCVRAITASISCSMRQFMAAAAPATRAMPSVPAKQRLQRHHARGGEEHADDGAEHDQGVHPRLGQAQVAAQAFGRAGAGGEDRFSHKRRPPVSLMAGQSSPPAASFNQEHPQGY
jgi:hypothetical protein